MQKAFYKFAKVLLAVLIFWNSPSVFSQNGKYKKIHFTYERKSNYTINDNGVFADTVLFKVNFPGLQYTIQKHPNDSTICGMVPLKKFSDEEKQRLIGILYHLNDKMEGTYNVKRNITTFSVERSDRNTSQTFRKYFQKDYHAFRFSIVVDYDKKTIVYNYPKTSHAKEFGGHTQDIKFSDDTLLSGSYTEKSDKFLFENVVVFDEKLNNKILPDIIFSNNEYGVRKIKTVYNTIELTAFSFD